MSRSAGVRHFLLPHPNADPGAVQGLVQSLSVDVIRPAADGLSLRYHLTADLSALRLPDPHPALRVDGLWRHTCLEAFIASSGDHEYWEYNFSPSGAWAAYHFTAYREGMAPLMKGAPPEIQSQTHAESLVLDVKLDLSWLARSPAARSLRLGLAAVIEDRAQVLSYWALKHPSAKPDFHHADGFVIELE